MKRIIKKMAFHDEDKNPQQFIVGKFGVKEIIQHSAQGEGDKWYYDVIFEDNRGMMIFSPVVVEYEIVDDGMPF